jgi:hypothetical protein
MATAEECIDLTTGEMPPPIPSPETDDEKSDREGDDELRLEITDKNIPDTLYQDFSGWESAGEDSLGITAYNPKLKIKLEDFHPALSRNARVREVTIEDFAQRIEIVFDEETKDTKDTKDHQVPVVGQDKSKGKRCAQTESLKKEDQTKRRKGKRGTWIAKSIIYEFQGIEDE